MDLPVIGPVLKKIFGSANDRMVARYLRLAKQVSELESSVRPLTDAEIKAIESVEESLDAALAISVELDEELPQPVLCIGSIYLVGAILQQVDEEGLVELQSILITPKGEDGVDPVA